MAHHYLEEEERESPDSVITTGEHVRFNCQIEQPFRETAAEDSLPEEPVGPPPTPKKKPPSCCPMPPIEPMTPSSDLVEALPTILVGIGFAYAIGMLTGAFIFSTPSLE
tara:strand:- start:914 stop:1240 length:327 start_codon:yes stop_codon:yes gene_type:complete